MMVSVMSNGEQATINEQKEFVFNSLHVRFIESESDLPKQEEVSAVFLVGFVDGKIIAARNERGWDVPGGHVEPTDSDLLAALRREANEEAGITFDTAKPYAVLKFEGKDLAMLFYVSNECQLEKFVPSDDALERDSMPISDFIQKYNWKKNVMELLINKALQVLK
jgi:8-oxo-dGTP pyrophosphatase MutT (NUDIX family)